MAPENTICRPAVGVCDRVDRCDGESPACPADEVTKAGVVCRAANGVCDVAEACDGVSNVCPVDQFEPSTKECRAGTGVCDPAETCSGAAAACPPNVFASRANKCYAQDPANPCDDDILCHDGGCPLPTVDLGQKCINCGAEGAPPEGYCADAERPCCVAGTPFDDIFFWCGETTLGNGSKVPQLCCDFKCSQRDDDQHRGTCDDNCLGDTVGPPGTRASSNPMAGGATRTPARRCARDPRSTPGIRYATPTAASGPGTSATTTPTARAMRSAAAPPTTTRAVPISCGITPGSAYASLCNETTICSP